MVTDFGTEVLPLGVFSGAGGGRRLGAAVGTGVLDLAAAWGAAWEAPSLNGFLAGGRAMWERTRAGLRELVRAGALPLIPQAEVTLHLPFDVADYVDFYASLDHAGNLGRILRPDSPPLLPNWRHLPVGYHGRAGTVVVSDTGIRRPAGLRAGDPGADGAPGAPTFGPSRRLDVEVELGFVVGAPSLLGARVPTAAFADHVFGVVLVNDWSARDIQGYEYVPLGPFLGKSFATSISPWVIPLEALTADRRRGPAQDPPVADYLRRDGDWALDIGFSLELNGDTVSEPTYSSMYWTPDQMLAHLTANGASLRTGDLFASGTVSGPLARQRGSLMELTWNGRDPLADGHTFLVDGDEVTISARSASGVPLGAVRGQILPAVP